MKYRAHRSASEDCKPPCSIPRVGSFDAFVFEASISSKLKVSCAGFSFGGFASAFGNTRISIDQAIMIKASILDASMVRIAQ